MGKRSLSSSLIHSLHSRRKIHAVCVSRVVRSHKILCCMYRHGTEHTQCDKHRFGGGRKNSFSQIKKCIYIHNTKGKHTTHLVATKRNGIENTIKKRHNFFRVDDADRESQ